MRIAILDDQQDILIIVQKLLCEQLPNDLFTIEAFLIRSEKDLPKGEYDIYLIDIEMPVNGFEYAKSLPITSKIVFVSIHDALVYESFNYNPYFFIRKKELAHDLHEFIKKLSPQMMITVPNEAGDKINIQLKDVILVKSEENYVSFEMKDKSYLKRMTFHEVEKQFKPIDFVCVRRGVLVNLQHIEQCDGHNIRLSNGNTIALAKSRKSQFAHIYSHWRIRQYSK